MLPVAVATLVVQRGGTAGDLGVVLAARFAALLSCALLGGVWADRLPRVRLMRAADLVRLVGVGALALAAAGSPPLGLLAALVVLVGAGEAFFRPAYGAVVPTVVPDALLVRANALSGVVQHLAAVLGPALAGVLLLVVGPAELLWLDAGTFGVSLLTLVRVHEPAAGPRERAALLREVADGVRAVRERPWMGALLVMSGAQLLLTVAPVTVLLPVALRDAGEPPARYGLVLAAGGAGGLIGALLGGRWSPRRPGAAGLAALTLWALPPLALLVDGDPAVLAAAWFLAYLGLGPFNVMWETAVQCAVPRELLARVVSLDWLCSFALLPLGLAVSGPVAGVVGWTPVLAVAAVAMVVTSAAVLAVPGVADLRGAGPAVGRDTGAA